MMRKRAMLLGLLGAFSIQGQDGPRQSFETSTGERIPIRPGGTIRLEHSYGYLTVEGWDEPDGEVSLAKSTDRFYQPSQKGEAEKRFGQVNVATQKPSDGDVTIATNVAVPRNFVKSAIRAGETVITLGMRPRDKRGVSLDYTVHVPRDANVVIHQDSGYVWVSDITGNIEVHSHTGDMIVQLPEAGRSSIDARTRLGSITSDLPGRKTSQLLVGAGFASPSAGSAQQVHLRMGRGSITIWRN